MSVLKLDTIGYIDEMNTYSKFSKKYENVELFVVKRR